MKHSNDQGMTLLEVVFALSIFMMGVGFIFKSDAVADKYLYKGQVRQQMMFYAAGQLEAQIEGIEPTADAEPFSNFHSEINTDGTDVRVDENPDLQIVQVKVNLTNSSTDPEPVILFTYRVRK